MKEIMIHLEKCNGCLTCTLACSAAHSVSGSITGAMTDGTPSRMQVLPVLGRPVPMMCLHCEEPACVEACMTGAMQKDPLTGIVTNEGHAQTCVGCWMCVMACPYGAVTRHPENRVALKCDRCSGRNEPACVASCPNQALEFVEVEVFAAVRQGQAALALVKAV